MATDLSFPHFVLHSGEDTVSEVNPLPVTLPSAVIAALEAGVLGGASGGLSGGVTQMGIWTVGLSGSLPAGSNNIGSVSISNLPAVQPVSIAGTISTAGTMSIVGTVATTAQGASAGPLGETVVLESSGRYSEPTFRRRRFGGANQAAVATTAAFATTYTGLVLTVPPSSLVNAYLDKVGISAILAQTSPLAVGLMVGQS